MLPNPESIQLLQYDVNELTQYVITFVHPSIKEDLDIIKQEVADCANINKVHEPFAQFHLDIIKLDDTCHYIMRMEARILLPYFQNYAQQTVKADLNYYQKLQSNVLYVFKNAKHSFEYLKDNQIQCQSARNIQLAFDSLERTIDQWFQAINLLIQHTHSAHQ